MSIGDTGVANASFLCATVKEGERRMNAVVEW